MYDQAENTYEDPRAASPAQAAIQRLNDDVEKAWAIANTLADRLRFVTREERARPEAVNSMATTEDESPLSREVGKATLRVRQLQTKLADAMERLEV